MTSSLLPLIANIRSALTEAFEKDTPSAVCAALYAIDDICTAAIAIEAAQADKTGTGLAEGESAGRNDIAQKPVGGSHDI